MADDPTTDGPDDGPAGPERRPSGLNRKVGPLSLRVWAFVVPVGIALGLLARRRLGGASAPVGDPVADAPTDVGAAGNGPAAGAGYGGGGGSTAGGGAATPPPAVGAPTDNLAWMQQAYRIVVARGIDAVEADTALRLYLSGQPMSEKHAAIVGLAIGAIGQPPEYVDPVTIATPEPVPAPSPGRADSGASVPPAPVPVAPTPAPVWMLGPGSSGEEVRQVQYIVKAYGHPEVNVTGTWDSLTTKAVQDWQRWFGLPVTGTLDRYHFDAMMGMAAAAAGAR